MVSVAEASEIILAYPFQPKIVKIDLVRAVGKVLGEKIFADRDFPPFDRVAMDGFAFRYEDWQRGQRNFSIVAVQAAGKPQLELQHTNSCIEVMTGSILPQGTDTVVRYEDVEKKGNDATILVQAVEIGQNIHRQGQDEKKGNTLLEPHIFLSPAEIALLASVGKNEVDVLSLPRVAIVSTGDELMEITETPGYYQIRKSNSYALEAALNTLGCNSTLFHLKDQKDIILNSLQTIVATYDVVIISGGVSKGKFDFIPEALAQIGVQKKFHQVSQRPGKPFWFGVAKDTAVFALPGNPVSTYMCFYRYIKPWLSKSLNLADRHLYAILAQDFNFQPKLTYFLQVKIQNEHGRLVAYPVMGGGSGDFANLKDVDGFIELPLERSEFKEGEAFPYIPFRH